jgi:hypothetical protein
MTTAAYNWPATYDGYDEHGNLLEPPLHPDGVPVRVQVAWAAAYTAVYGDEAAEHLAVYGDEMAAYLRRHADARAKS